MRTSSGFWMNDSWAQWMVVCEMSSCSVPEDHRQYRGFGLGYFYYIKSLQRYKHKHPHIYFMFL